MSSRLEIEPGERPASGQELPRSRVPLRALLLMIAVAALVGGSWWVGHGGKPAPQDLSAVPEIHADAGPVKEVPSDRGGMVVPGQDSVLLNRDTPKTEELLPPSEAVKQRPVAATPPAPLAPAPQTATTLSQNAIPATPPAIPQPSAPVTPVPQPPVAAAPAAASAAPIGGPAPKVAPPPNIAGPGYRLQLGALTSEEAARSEWQKLQKQQPDILGKLSLTIARADLGAKGVYYRIQAGPIADAAAAAQQCAALKSRNVGCLLVKP